jgi:hypothetical protein
MQNTKHAIQKIRVYLLYYTIIKSILSIFIFFKFPENYNV